MSKSRKTWGALLCAAVLLIGLLCSAFTVLPEAADMILVPIYVNGVRADSGYLYDSTTFVPVAEFSERLCRQCVAQWDEAEQTVTVTAPGLTLTAAVGEQYVTANDRALDVPAGIARVEGEAVIPVRVLAKAFGAEVIWHSDAEGVNVDTGEQIFIEDADTYYNDDDLYWMSHLIYSEAGNQPLEGKIAVGNVVLNRVADDSCPDTIYGVISQPGQFDVFSGGSIYAEPNEESVAAAKLCLEGVKAIEQGLFFVNPRTGADGWFRMNRVFVARIQDHDFYA